MKPIIKVNLGCGNTYTKNWVNVEWTWNLRVRTHPLSRLFVPLLRYLKVIDTTIGVPPNLILHDVRKKLPFKDASVDFIYASHLLEHLKKYEALCVIEDCYRCLKPGGVIRIVVPDLELLAKEYVQKNNSYFREVAKTPSARASLFSEEMTLADKFIAIMFFCERERPKPTKITDKIKLKIFPPGPHHQYAYDYETLSAMLHDSGFGVIERRSFGVGEVPDVDKLDNMPLISLYVEAKRQDQE